MTIEQKKQRLAKLLHENTQYFQEVAESLGLSWEKGGKHAFRKEPAFSKKSIVYEITIHEDLFGHLVSASIDPTAMDTTAIKVNPPDKMTFYQYVQKMFEVFFYCFNQDKLAPYFSNSLIEKIYDSGNVRSAEGEKIPIYPWGIPAELGQQLHDFILENGLEKSLEIGLAYGLSALFICEAHRRRQKGIHIAIDPAQTSNFSQSALYQIKQANLQPYFKHVESPDYHALPELHRGNQTFDFIFIDGLHLFDYVLLDFFYADLLLENKGYIAFDDSTLPGVTPVIDFVGTNRNYKRIDVGLGRLTIFKKESEDKRFLGDPCEFSDFFKAKPAPKKLPPSKVRIHTELIEQFVKAYSSLVNTDRILVKVPWDYQLNIEGIKTTKWRISVSANGVRYSRLDQLSKGLHLSSNSEKKGDSVDEPFDTFPIPEYEHFEKAPGLVKYEKIAIVGLSARFPKSSTVNAFWDNLVKLKPLFSEVPKDRWNWDSRNGNPVANLKNNYVKWGGFIEDVDSFDASFFNISPSEATSMDPHQRLLLEETYKCMEDAGYFAEQLAGNRTGVFLALYNQSFQSLLAEKDDLNFHAITGDISFTANRISYFFNFSGASETIHTSCSSSAVALHRAAKALQNKECDVTLVAAANIYFSPAPALGLSQMGLLSKNNRCAPFDKNAAGLILGEGVGVAMLKRLKDAERDNDHIYGSLVGSATSHAGNLSGSLMLPNSISQADLIKQTLQRAGLDLSDLTYIEGHGTGGVGDEIELRALQGLWHKNERSKNGLLVGSVKSYLGLNEAVGGVTQLIKILLMMKHKKLIPTLNFTELPDSINPTSRSLSILKEIKKWDKTLDENGQVKPRRAGMNTYGLGGTAAFLILEEYEDKSVGSETKSSNGPVLIVLSAKTKDRLRDMVKNFKAYITSPHAPRPLPLHEVAYTLQVGREAIKHRLAVLVTSRQELINKLKIFLSRSLADFQDNKILTGTIKKSGSKNTTDSKQQKHEAEREVQEALREKNLKKLGLLWVQGHKVPWQKLYQGRAVKKTSLPPYPFRKTTYGLGPQEVNSKQAERQQQQLHKDKDISKQISTGDRVIQLISKILGMKTTELGLDLPLHQYGFDSILLMQLFQQLQSQFDPSMDLVKLQECRTVKDIINSVSSRNVYNPNTSRQPQEISVPKAWPQFPELIHLNQSVAGRPVFWVHGGLGGVEAFRGPALRSQRPFYGLQARGWMTDRTPLHGIQALAAYFVNIIQFVQPQGPYDLGGYSLGGMVAYEVARQLQELREKVNTVTMLDSFDSASIKTIMLSQIGDRSQKSVILTIANLALQSITGTESGKISPKLIHQNDVDVHRTDEEFLHQVVKLARVRGANKKETQLRTQIQQKIKIENAYALDQFSVQPLLHPNEVICYYFRNKGGHFLGDLAPYFTLSSDAIPPDPKNYWQEWQHNFPRLHIIDVDASNHMMLLSDPKVRETILSFCEKLYSEKGMSPQFLTAFKRKTRKIHGTIK